MNRRQYIPPEYSPHMEIAATNVIYAYFDNGWLNIGIFQIDS